VAIEGGISRPFEVTFTENGGTVTYLKPLPVAVPILRLERPRMGNVRFSVRLGAGDRHFAGQWDGEKLDGAIAASADGAPVLGTFELRR
jgi:hypothetical protein